MDTGRYEVNNKLYLLGIGCLLLALILFFFSLYILPYLVWELHYDIPEFVSRSIVSLQERWGYSPKASKVVFWSILFVSSVLLAFISFKISNYLDRVMLEKEGAIEPAKDTALEENGLSSERLQQELKDTMSLSAKILLLMIVIVCVILLLHEMIKIV